eukprot:CAMPEP_0203793008 /NCGR_PEP_ID=MMETSP0100_2-20121128/5601_1 /ASSEMBLY_ACC=CAM_ASM_000210 /TAXON_ID=96639 /ORGANISM=" , Strain NY0313808BC1" /LENGTH=875 /DNA_ID=CAMNT_0050696689 /DNA_START=650 /DNA_END=3278 /DNA_ORIENTATION=+
MPEFILVGMAAGEWGSGLSPIEELGNVKGVSLYQWLAFQFETYVLLSIEVNHRMEIALDKVLGRGKEDFLLRGLPHVDTAQPPTYFGVGSFFFGRKNKKMGSAEMGVDKPTVREIVLVGGGHSHAFVIKNFGMNPEPGTTITLISPSVETPYSGMLPGFVSGQYSREECHIDLMRLCQFAHVRLIQGAVYKIDTSEQTVYVLGGDEEIDRPPVRYDVLSIDIGSSPALLSPGLVGEQLCPTPVKPISEFSSKWDKLMHTVVISKKKEFVVAVVGAGAGGVELMLSMEARLENVLATYPNAPTVKFVLVANKGVVCPSHNIRVQSIFARILKEREILVLLNFQVESIDGSRLVAADGRAIEIDECIWCTNASAQEWLADSGLATNTGGFLRVKDTLQSENVENIFGAGDCADMINHPRPKAGVFAVRQGPPLAANLRRYVRKLINPSNAGPLEHYYPQSSFLGIIGTGTKYCVASRGEMALEGEWLYALKDWIDRKWMAGYSSQLPLMSRPDGDEEEDVNDSLKKLTKASAMRCGGCGAKVGKSVLERVMSGMSPPTRPEVTIGLDAPDDCAVITFGDTKQGALVAQTVDFFRSFIDDPFVFGQIATNHALSDCHAMCAVPISAMAIAVVPFASEAIVQGTLSQMMGGVCSMLRASNCALVGGHSCEGKELSLGLSVSGSIPAGAKILTKGGTKEGDVLVVTKAIGTGVIAAANMRVLAKGTWVEGAIKSMLVSNEKPAFLARDNNATACTDVTGFGLIGHLIEMMDASGLCAHLSLDDVPLLQGAQNCVEAGVFSSLQPQNIRLKHAIKNHAEYSARPEYQLLFDPQTAGGLLVTLPKQDADKFIGLMRDNGYNHAKIIGRINKKTADGFKVVIV